MNNRRKLLAAFGLSVLAAPRASFAQQQGKVWRIGVLWEAEQTYYVPMIDAFKAGMRDLGYAEARDYAVEQRSAKNDLARLPALATELLALKVDIIVPSGTPSAISVLKATRKLPILIVTVGDPVGSGLAVDLRRPGGNVTGLTNLTSELVTKRLDLLRQILPGISRVGYLYNPDNAGSTRSFRQFESDCDKLGFEQLEQAIDWLPRGQFAVVLNEMARKLVGPHQDTMEALDLEQEGLYVGVTAAADGYLVEMVAGHGAS